MNIVELMTLFAIAFVFVITPRPSTLVVFAKSMLQGFASAFYLSLGMVLGDLVYLSVVIFSPDLFSTFITPVMGIVRILGGVYLIYLGIRVWNAYKVVLSEQSKYKSSINEFLTGFFDFNHQSKSNDLLYCNIASIYRSYSG